jgi:GNAT superfamily N-acetyltransferase
MTLVLTDAPTDADRETVSSGLADFSEQQAGYRDYKPLAALLKDDQGATLGGMIGRTSYGMLFIDTVFLPRDRRGHELGSRLLDMMETEGIRRGCKVGFLMTITFQAPGFYAKYGWTEFNRIACDPPGTARVFMTKTF